MGEPMPQGGDSPRRLRARGAVAGVLAIPLVAYAGTNALVSNLFSLLVAPVAVLIFLVAINAALRAFVPKAALSQADLIVAFAIASVAGSVSSEWAYITQPPIHSLAYQAKTDPLVRDRMLPNAPGWLVVKDPAAVRDIANGGLGLGYVVSKLQLYLPKYLGWGLVMGLMLSAYLCLNSLMRGAWCRNERLTFPLIQLPVAMSEGGGSGGMWRSRPMWIAFAIMFAIDILNGLNYLYPNLPAIPVKEYLRIEQFFPDPPLSNMGFMPISLYPFLAAIGLLMPSDLLVSLILFFLLRKATHVALAANGFPQHTFSGTAISPGPPFFDEQTWGAVLAIFLGALWYSRGYLRKVVTDIRTGAASDDGGIRHRWTFAGLVVSIAGLVVIGASGGLPVPWLILYLCLLLAFGAVVARLRAQLGPPTHEFAYFSATSFLGRFFGTSWLTDQQATTLSTVFFPFNRIARTHPMPYQLEAIKMTRDEKVAQRPIFWLILGSSIGAFVLAFFFLHVMAYRTGNPNAWPEHPMMMRTMIEERHGPDPIGMLMTGVGFGVVAVLDFIRFRIPGFPIHPAGYVLSMNFGVDYYWFGLLIALVVKTLVTRYGGHPGYARLRNIAFGILLGEYLAEAIWMTVALVTHQSTYTISFSERGFGAM